MSNTPNSSVNGNSGSQTEHTMTPEPDDTTPLLGPEAQALISCNQKLQELGIDNTIQLPRLVIIGDQSTGKSSVIEAISTVSVPKAKGCCTQCPVAINLSSGQSSASPWTCTVSIEESYEFVEALVSKGVTKANPYGPWQRRNQIKIVPVKTTHDKREVAELIRAAQLAVVNPGTHPNQFLDPRSRQAFTSQGTKFSPNIIRLDVSEGDWPNLSFVDLPGVIANTGKEKDKYLVKLIKNLVIEYASAERSVNMLTLPMTHDLENSQACAIIQELKAEPHTLAIFTKADLADGDQQRQFLQRLTREDDLGFEHGYHFVVMPDNTEQIQARAIEADFFGKTPWSLLEKQYQDRLGVGNLTMYLRRLLFEKTAETLPDNLNSIRSRLSNIDAELNQLPAPPNTVLLPMQLQQSVTEFANATMSLFSGTSSEPSQGVSASYAWTQNALDFRRTIIQARPTVFLMSSKEQARLNKAIAKVESLQTSASAVEISSGDEDDQTVSVKAETSGIAKFDPVHRFRLEEIRELNNRYYHACVPGEMELRAIEAMNKLSVKHWDTLLSHFMDKNSRLLTQQLMEEMTRTFAQYAHLELYVVIQNFIKDYLDEAMHQERTHAEAICQLECTKPLTYDQVGMKEKETLCLAERLDKRDQQRMKLAKAEQEAAQGVPKPKTKKDDTVLGPDPYETELKMSAKTRAYYEVAVTRFVDNVSLGIFGRLLPACTHQLVESLKEHLGLYDPNKHEQIIKWMAEHPEREARRQDLIQEKIRLNEGLRYITAVLGRQRPRSAESFKRRPSGSPPTEDLPKTPSKRTKAAHAGHENNPLLSPPTTRKMTQRARNMKLND